MALTTFLLDRPIPRNFIELGRLVLDPKYPNQDFCQPLLHSEVTIQDLEDFQETLKKVRNTGLEIKLLSLLSFTPSDSSDSRATISSPLCNIHQLRDPNTHFSNACKEPKVREWLEGRSMSRFSNVYFVCGFKTLQDAKVTVSHSAEIDVGISGGAPLTAFTGVPIPIPSDSGLDVTVGVSSSNERGKSTSYTATGEHVYAVQYRKVKFSFFSSRHIDQAYLERGNRWRSYVGARAGDEVEDGIDVEVSSPISLSDLKGRYESITFNEEEILYRE